MKTYDITSTRKVSSEDIDNVVADAMSGMTYWADKARVKKGCEPKEETQYLSETLTHGGTLEIHDAEDNVWITLTLERFLAALAKVNFDFEQYDSYDAEAAVQQAIFGEVVYG